MAQKTSPFTTKLFTVNKQFINVDKLLGNKNKLKVAEEKRNRFWWQRKRIEDKEKQLENKDEGTGDEKKTTKKFSLPSFGFLDVIKNFLFKTLFGFFVVRLLPQLPKLKGLVMTTLKVSDFIIGIAGSILNALATFIDAGYKAFDFARGQIKLIGGDKGLAMMDKVFSMSNTMLNTMFIAAMLFSDLVESDARGGAAQQAVDFVKERVVEQGVKQAAGRQIIQALVSRVIASPAAVIGIVGLASSLLGEATFQLRKVSQKVEKDAYKGLADAQKDPNPITRFFKTGFYQAFAIPGLRLYNFISTGVGTLLDIIGAPFRYAIELINYGVMRITGDEDGIKRQRENLGKLDARIREQLRQIVNTLSFGTLAKDQGSFGSLFGEGAVKSMGYASGGEVTRGGELLGGVKRGFERAKVTRQIKVATAPLQPGVDVGGMTPYGDGKEGVSKLEAFFPNPDNPGTINPYRYLTKAHSIVENSPFFAPVLGLATKIILGDRPSETDYKAVGTSINSFFGSILDTTNAAGKKTSLTDEIGSFDISKIIQNSIQDSISSAASSILTDLANQFKLKRTEGTGQKESPSAQNGPGATENPLAQFGGQAQFVIGDSIAHGFAGRSGNGTDSGDTKVGRKPAEVLNILKSKGDSLKGVLIDLSTGIANNPSDITSVEAQLSYLKSIGARVRVLGVGNQWSQKNGDVNSKLNSLVSKYGFYFYGGFDAKDDKLGVHGTPASYEFLKQKRESDTASTKGNEGNGGLETGKGYGNAGSKIAGELGRYIYQKLKSPQQFQAVTEHPEFGGVDNSAHAQNSYHKYGRAIDIGAYAYEQGPVLNVIAQFNKMKGVKPVELLKAGDPGHGNHVHVAYKGGGPVYKTDYALTHPGEYVIDADSVRSFGIDFYDIINQVETVSQRKNAAERLVQILSQYTEDGYPETEEDYTYYIGEKQRTVIPSYPVMINQPSPGGGGVSEEDYSQDYLYT